MNSNGQSSGGNGKDWRSNPEVFARLVEDGMKQAVQEAIREHHLLGRPVAIWQDGRVVHLYPDGSTHPVESEAAVPASEGTAPDGDR